MDNLRNQSAHCVERYIEASISSGGSNSDEIRMTQGIVIVDLQGLTVKEHACLRCNYFMP